MSGLGLRFGLALVVAWFSMAACTHYNGVAVREDGTVLMTVETSFLFWVDYDVLECQQEGYRLNCHELAVRQGAPASGELSRPRLRPNLTGGGPGTAPSSGAVVSFDDGAGVRQVDPLTLIGDEVVLRLVGGTERRVTVVDFKDRQVVVRYRGSEWAYFPDEIALLTPQRD